MANLAELKDALASTPDALLPDQLLEQLVWDALDLVTSPDRAGLTKSAEEAAALARGVLAAHPLDGRGWRLWYAGQVQGLARVMRAAHGRRLARSTSALLRSRKHSVQILNALSLSDLNLSELARRLDLDLSHLSREIALLIEHELVDTTKTGRERLARITTRGTAALDELNSTSPKAPPTRPTFEVTHAKSDTKDLTEKLLSVRSLAS